ncbi:WSC domain-containing protein [Aspergillus pseudotamarii]|uniref:WSC domain-containing protein n=1 Tax=Aspergillus pseudotamarii TaxID=132259 RepID=A0A5N6SZ98_ASPPS|nr:WSC domain-containing protein [Aspergillus pseudotamarii]KAE8139952.1 WSC domain-containing protein [Aspergillus pseudotamarii]
MKLFSTSAAYLAIPMALLVSAQRSTESLVACYGDSGTFEEEGSYPYQSPGYCANLCRKTDAQYMALHAGNQCWCGTSLPDKKSLVADDKCNTKCSGWPDTTCGSDDAWSVWQLSPSSKEVTETASTSTSAAISHSGNATVTSTSSSLASATPGSNSTASATKSGNASQSASSAGATPTTSTSAATRRFKLPFFL